MHEHPGPDDGRELGEAVVDRHQGGEGETFGLLRAGPTGQAQNRESGNGTGSAEDQAETDHDGTSHGRVLHYREVGERTDGTGQDGEGELEMQGLLGEVPAVEEGTNHRTGRADGTEGADELLRELELVHHVVIHGGAEAGREVIEGQEGDDAPECRRFEGLTEGKGGLLHLHRVDARLVFLEPEPGQERHSRGCAHGDESRRVQCACGVGTTGNPAAGNGGGNLGGVEPEPLYALELADHVVLLPVFHHHRVHNHVGGGRAHSSEQEGGDDERSITQSGEPEESAGRHGIESQEPGFAPVAEERDEVADQAVERLDQPGNGEHSQVGRGLSLIEVHHFFEVETEGLTDQTACLRQTLGKVNDTEQIDESFDVRAVVGRTATILMVVVHGNFNLSCGYDTSL